MTYVWHGRQFVVVAAGGHGESGLPTSDAVVAFALPAPGEPTRDLWDRTIDQPGGRFVVKMAAIVVVLGVVLAAVARRGRRRQKTATRPG